MNFKVCMMSINKSDNVHSLSTRSEFQIIIQEQPTN